MSTDPKSPQVPAINRVEKVWYFLKEKKVSRFPSSSVSDLKDLEIRYNQVSMLPATVRTAPPGIEAR